MAARTSRYQHVMHLAQAHARLVSGCDRAACAPRLELSGRPVPWVVGLSTASRLVLVAEPWSHLHSLHRKKRGFSVAAERLRSVLDVAVAAIPGAGLALQIWSDDGTFDAGLAEKLGRSAGRAPDLFGPERMAEAVEAVRLVVRPDMVADPNPLVAVLAFLRSVGSG